MKMGLICFLMGHKPKLKYQHEWIGPSLTINEDGSLKWETVVIEPRSYYCHCIRCFKNFHENKPR